MRIALATPSYNLMEEGYGTKKYSKFGAYPPLGLGYIASALEKAGHTVKIIDAQSAQYNKHDILKEVKEFNSEAFGISSVTANSKSACEIINYIKKELNIFTFMGGAHSTCFSDLIYQEGTLADCLVIGEGERTIIEVINSINNKNKWKEIDGICFLDENKKIIKTNKRILDLDLDLIDPPARHLFNNDLYHPIPNLYRQLPATNMITSRGCPYGRCAFCYEAGKMGHKYRRHSPERIIREIENLAKDWGIKEIAFWDDNFIVNKDWVSKFCNLLKTKKLNISWSCYSRVDMVSKEILETIADAGCWSIFYGLESGVQDLLDIVDKGITLEQSRRAIQWTHEAGIETRGSFMLALPGENPQKAKQTIKFAIDLNLDSAQFLATYPEFGTKLYDKAMLAGKFLEYKGRHGVTYVPSGYKNADEVKKIVNSAYRRFYLRPSFFLKYIKRIKSIKDLSRFYDGFKMVVGIMSTPKKSPKPTVDANNNQKNT